MSDSAETTVTRRDRPVGICPRGDAVIRAFDQIGKKCARPLASGSKCPGVIRSALAAVEWTKCPECHAIGRTGDDVCSRCGGEGWLYDRRRLPV
jgi:DnaJ-class molecular chaperone